MKEITIIDTMREVDMDEIRDYCECNGIEVPKEDSNEYWDIVHHLKSWDWEDFVDNIKHRLTNERLVVTGTLGLWNGKHDIYAAVKEGLYEAIMYCISDSILDVDVQFNDGVL